MLNFFNNLKTILLIGLIQSCYFSETSILEKSKSDTKTSNGNSRILQKSTSLLSYQVKINVSGLSDPNYVPKVGAPIIFKLLYSDSASSSYFNFDLTYQGEQDFTITIPNTALNVSLSSNTSRCFFEKTPSSIHLTDGGTLAINDSISQDYDLKLICNNYTDGFFKFKLPTLTIAQWAYDKVPFKISHTVFANTSAFNASTEFFGPSHYVEEKSLIEQKISSSLHRITRFSITKFPGYLKNCQFLYQGILSDDVHLKGKPKNQADLIEIVCEENNNIQLATKDVVFNYDGPDLVAPEKINLAFEMWTEPVKPEVYFSGPVKSVVLSVPQTYTEFIYSSKNLGNTGLNCILIDSAGNKFSTPGTGIILNLELQPFTFDCDSPQTVYSLQLNSLELENMFVNGPVYPGTNFSDSPVVSFIDNSGAQVDPNLNISFSLLVHKETSCSESLIYPPSWSSVLSASNNLNSGNNFHAVFSSFKVLAPGKYSMYAKLTSVPSGNLQIENSECFDFTIAAPPVIKVTLGVAGANPNKLLKTGNNSITWQGQQLQTLIPFSHGHNNYKGTNSTSLCESIVSYYNQYKNYTANGLNKGLAHFQSFCPAGKTYILDSFEVENCVESNGTKAKYELKVICE